MTTFAQVTNSQIYKEQTATLDKEAIAFHLKTTLFNQLKTRGNLATSVAWYLTEEQALAFAKMTLNELDDPKSNGARELGLLEDILATNPFSNIIERDSITFLDLGGGNGEKAIKILSKLPVTTANYYNLETSPYMSIFCMANIMAGLNPTNRDPNIVFRAGLFDEKLIENASKINLPDVIALIDERAKALTQAKDALDTLEASDAFKIYEAKKRAQWEKLTFQQKKCAIDRENAMLDALIAQEDAIDHRGITDLNFDTQDAYDKLISTPRPITYAKICAQIGKARKLLTHASEWRSAGFTWRNESPMHVLEQLKERALNASDFWSDKTLQRSDYLLRQNINRAFAFDASQKLISLKADLEAGRDDQIYNKLHQLEIELMHATSIIPTGETDYGQVRVKEGWTGNMTFKGQPLFNRSTDQRNYKEYHVLVGNSLSHCDFLNSNLLHPFHAAMYLDSGRFSHQVVGLLGQTIGNFNAVQRAQILKNIYNAIEPGGYLLLGAELRPSAEDPQLQQKIEQLQTNYGDPRHNQGQEGSGAKFLRYATRQIGIPDHALAYRVEYENNCVNMYFDVKENAEAKLGDEKIPLTKGQQLLAASSYKFELTELTDLVTQAGFTIEQSPDRQNYTTLLARK